MRLQFAPFFVAGSMHPVVCWKDQPARIVQGMPFVVLMVLGVVGS